MENIKVLFVVDQGIDPEFKYGSREMHPLAFQMLLQEKKVLVEGKPGIVTSMYYDFNVNEADYVVIHVQTLE